MWQLLTKKPSFIFYKKLFNKTNTNLLRVFGNLNLNQFSTYDKDIFRKQIEEGPSLKDFIEGTLTQKGKQEETINVKEELIPYIKEEDLHGQNRRGIYLCDNYCLAQTVRDSNKKLHQRPLQNQHKKLFFEVFGCQMNVNDTEVVWSILKSHGYLKTNNIKEADVILIMTCAIRENAESKVWSRLKLYRKMIRMKNTYQINPVKIGILGCMAERLKTALFEKAKTLDLVAGPDSYKDLPRLLALTYSNQTAINVMLSLDETYADITPVRLNEDGCSAFVSVMRGCDNMCTYCIVPFTRGRERSRPMESILDEVRILSDQGIKEVTLLGQNVNSYRDLNSVSHYSDTKLAKGFKTVYKSKQGGARFATLLDKVSSINPNLRIRFTSPHPKDFPDEILYLIKERPNICDSIHLPAQSGNNEILDLMRRGYTRESYLELVDKVRSIIPGVHISSDFIAGFCGETEEQFQDTLSLMDIVKYNVAFLFGYSMREKTTAHRRYKDTVSSEEKGQRVQRMVELFRKHADILNKQQIGSVQLVLVEGPSKKSKEEFCGRTDGNIKIIFPNNSIPESIHSTNCQLVRSGDYITVLVTDANSQSLRGVPLYHSSIQLFVNEDGQQFVNSSKIYNKQSLVS